ncbi:MAG TPA: SMC-Scp complex subunit ScpB [bacterium]|nr:SMC-Scp complex subunit ScpB [bacterium]
MDTLIEPTNRIAGQVAVVDSDAERFVQAVEAVLFAAHEPLAPTMLHSLNGHTGWTLDAVVDEINRRLEQGGHPMRVRKVAGGYQMYILPEFGAIVEAALVKTKTQRLSRAGLETLAIIAYRQPCSTPEIERIRGVAADAPVRTLLERNLITIKGRSDGPGRPLLYGTTDEFLRYFGLNSIEDLPREEELSALLAARTEEQMREKAAEGEHALRLRLPEADGAETDAGESAPVEDVRATPPPNLDN